MSSLPATLYTGERFDNNCAVIWPKNEDYLAAIWAFCSSPAFNEAVREIDQSLKVMNATLLKGPFDSHHWQVVANESVPLAEPCSNDPTQWPFKGDIASSTDQLQAAVARMLGYCRPDQAQTNDAIDALADMDGIVCILAVRGERPAAERILDVLRTAYSPPLTPPYQEGERGGWSDAILHKLVTDAGCKPGTLLDEWLREKFFELHCKRFHHRPFIWHIWDGRKDGFSCLVNYHKLDHKRLETLTYSYLQDWINTQAAAANEGTKPPRRQYDSARSVALSRTQR